LTGTLLKAKWLFLVSIPKVIIQIV
jgi:hypothetical protein